MTATSAIPESRVSLTSVATRLQIVHESRCPESGPSCLQGDQSAYLHDQFVSVAEWRAVADVDLSQSWGAEIHLPLRLVDTTIDYRRLDGSLFTPPDPNLHHRNETLVGPGDPWLLGRHTRRVGPVALTAKLGVSLPLGNTVENPFALGELGKEHQHVQLGTGSLSPVVALSAQHPIGPVALGAYGQVQLGLLENRHGYMAGHRSSVGVSAGYLLSSGLDANLTLDAADERPERWDGVVMQDGNLGRTDVLLGAGFTWQQPRFWLSASVKVPVYQRLAHDADEAAALSYPGIAELTVGWRLQAPWQDPTR